MRIFWLALVAFAASAPQALSPALEESSARCVTITASPDDRVAPPPKVSPGTPPLLSFRYYEGQQHYRFGNMDLTFDDAGH